MCLYPINKSFSIVGKFNRKFRYIQFFAGTHGYYITFLIDDSTRVTIFTNQHSVKSVLKLYGDFTVRYHKHYSQPMFHFSFGNYCGENTLNFTEKLESEL